MKAAVAPAAARSSRWPSGRTRGSLAVFAIAAALAVLEMSRFWQDPFHAILGDGLHYSDQFQTVWFLRWVPWRLSHGHNPFVSNYMYYPHGLPLAWNTATYVLGIIAAPVTFSCGSLFCYGLLMTLAPACAALTAFWWLRRYPAGLLGPATGALFIGFGPYLSGQLLGHLNLVTIVMVPLILMLLEDLCWRHPRPDRRSAVYLGLAASVQAGVSEEILLITGLAVAIVLCCSYGWARHATVALLDAQLRYLLLAVGVFVLLSGPMLIQQLFGSAHVHVAGAAAHSHLEDLVKPHGRQYLTFGFGRSQPLNDSEDGLYLGIALCVLVIIGIALTGRRDVLVRICATAGGIFLLLALGNPVLWAIIRVGGSASPFSSVLSLRFAMPFGFAVAWLLSRWVGAAVRAPRRKTGWAGAAAIVVSAASVLPMPAPAGRVAPEPAFYTSSMMTRMLPAGSPVLLLPAPDQWSAVGLLHQADSEFRFRQTGGWALHTYPRVTGGSAAPDSALARLAYAANRTPAHAKLSVSPDTGDLVLGREQLAEQGYRAVVVEHGTENYAAQLTLAQQLAGGRPPTYDGLGVSVWLLPGG